MPGYAGNSTNQSFTALTNASFKTTMVAQIKPQTEAAGRAGVFELIILGLLIMTILVGNSLVCMAYKNVSRRLKSITNCFVISLAASDILVGGFSLPLWAVFRMGA